MTLKTIQNHLDGSYTGLVNKTIAFPMKGEGEFQLLENFNHLREHPGKCWGRSLIGQAATTVILKVQWAQIPFVESGDVNSREHPAFLYAS